MASTLKCCVALSVAVLFLFVTSSNCLVAPFIKPCSRSSPNLNECVTRVINEVGGQFAQYGIPEAGVESMDPINLGQIAIRNTGLTIIFDDTVVTGLRNFKLNSFKMQPDKKRVMIDFVSNVTLRAQYKIDGQVLILPIRGEGDAKIKITNLNIVLRYSYADVVDSSGVTHWNITNTKQSYKMDRAYFKFQNLFGGRNKQLADTTHLFVNENWQGIMSEIAPPALEQIVSGAVRVVNSFYQRTPVSELLLP